MSDYFDKLIEQELINEILPPSKKINLDKCDFFSTFCAKKIDDFNSLEDMHNHEKFKKIVDKLNCKYPFLKIDEFIEDFIDGLFNKHIIEKYNFIEKNDFRTIIGKGNLNMVQARHKQLNSNTDYARRHNLNEKITSESYSFLRKECDYFHTELDYVSNYNNATAIIILNYLVNNYEINNIISNKKIISKNNIEYYNVNMTDKISKIIKDDEELIKNNLYNKKILKYSSDEYHIGINFEDIEKKIKYIVSNEHKGIIYSKIILKLIEEFPLIQHIPHYQVINKILIRYEKEIGIFISESAKYNQDPTERRYFTIINYNNNKLNTVIGGTSQFFGRKNDPLLFINDIMYLKKGDFNDEDDQVSRIAGLILSGTQKMISEPEKFSEFDFAVNMNGFKPTIEQARVIEISKIIIKPECQIIHLKIMLDDDINVDLIESIRKVLPKKEQAMIICFNEISEEVKNLISDNSSIQIIDKQSLYHWAEITPQIPSRKNSIVKIMSGNNLGKIAKINNINYETGKAGIQIIPSGEEDVEYIGFLEEINLDEDEILKDHLILCENYFKFLSIVGKNSNTEQFEKAIFNSEQIIANTNAFKDRWDLKFNVEFNATCESFLSIINPSQNIFRNIFHCTCNHFQTQNTLCSHLIAILNYIGMKTKSFSENWDQDNNIFYSCILKI